MADNMKYRYTILSTVIETKKPVEYLKKFEERECKKDLPEIVLEMKDDCQDNQCYGIQYIFPKQKESIRSLFFSQKDREQYLYSSEDDYSKLHMNINENCSEEIFLELFIAGVYSFLSRKPKSAYPRQV